MWSLHAIHPNATLSIEEQNEVFEHFSAVHFEDFIISNGIEIQSDRTLRNGATVKNSIQRLAETWEMHLRRFLSHSEINLPQMLHNFRDDSVGLHLKKWIYLKLKKIGLEWLTPADELEREALLLGMAMMLGDSLEYGVSIMHIFENEELVSGILKGEDAREENLAQA